MILGEWLEAGGQVAVVELLVHGQYGYVHHGCRCQVCTGANTAQKARWKAAHPGRDAEYQRRYRANARAATKESSARDLTPRTGAE